MRKVVLRFYIENENKEKEILTLCAEFDPSIKRYTDDLLAMQEDRSVLIKSKNVRVLNDKSSKNWDHCFIINTSFEGCYVKTPFPVLNFNFPRITEPGEYPYYNKQ